MQTEKGLELVFRMQFCWNFFKNCSLSYKFIDNSIQKCCMEKIPGCSEHLSLVWHALKEARAKNSNLAVIWLDIANTYGSILHKLIVFSLHRYGVSPQWIRLIQTYHEGNFSKSLCESATSAWHRHNQGIFGGCTLSIILFLAGMNINLNTQCKPVSLNLPLTIPHCRYFVLSWMT